MHVHVHTLYIVYVHLLYAYVLALLMYMYSLTHFIKQAISTMMQYHITHTHTLLSPPLSLLSLSTISLEIINLRSIREGSD